ncbi:unnamed protein product [Cyprideis torosa]|uniref:Uncharacterized protein n=1 Tax=Cyprideis torosa TaxID=163714 RepID=A0A7R8WES2_9CRUS|nr:unnamed protein product [Cyprideis torosa]CAG0896115.1 unnamed protein product [Cyprideis torosa]
MPDTTKEELWDAEHAWIGGAVLDGSVWRWNSSGKELESFISGELPIDDFYGLTINVHSKELVPFKLKSLSLSPGHQTIHSYVCETDPRETGQTGSSVPQTVARDPSECQAELLVAKEERTAALERELREERRLLATKEEMILKQQELLVAKEERTAALENDLREEKRRNGVKISALERELREERRLRGTKDAKISALEEKNSVLEDQLEAHSRHCFPGSASLPQEGVITATKRELQNLAQPGASPQPPSLTIGAWTIHLFRRQETNLFLVVTHCGRVDQAYSLTFQVRMWSSSTRTYTGEYFDRRRRTGAVDLQSKVDLSNHLSKYGDEESFRLEVRLLEAVATDVKANTEKNEFTIKARLANVSAMEPFDQVYSEPHFLRGFRLRLAAIRGSDSLFLALSCIGNVVEGDYSVRVTKTVTLERIGLKGGPETKSATVTYDRRYVVLGWNFVKWEELVAPGSGWIGEDGSVSVTAAVKINK